MPIDDEYSQWLRIPPDVSRPPNHYALLGLPTFCADAKAIEEAADRQLERLDRHALHPDLERRARCQRMMDEVAQARLTVIHPQRRAAYDRWLIANGVAALPTRSDASEATEDSTDADTPTAAPQAIAIPIQQRLRRALRGMEAYSTWIIAAAITAMFAIAYLAYLHSVGRPQYGVLPTDRDGVFVVSPPGQANKARPKAKPQGSATRPGPSTRPERDGGAAEDQGPANGEGPQPPVTVAATRSATAPAPEQWRLLVYNHEGTARVLQNGVEVMQLAGPEARFTPTLELTQGDVISLVVNASGNGYVRVAGTATPRPSRLLPMPADIKDLTGETLDELDAEKVDAVKAATPVGPGDPAAKVAWNLMARDFPLYDSQCMTAGDRKDFSLGFIFRTERTEATRPFGDFPKPQPTPPGAWTGSVLGSSAGPKVHVTCNGQQWGSFYDPGVFKTPERSLAPGDVIAIHAEGGEGPVRAAIISSDGKVFIPLRAADLHDVTGLPLTNLPAPLVQSTKRTAVAVAKVPLDQLKKWEGLNDGHAPHGSEYFTADYPAYYNMAFVISDHLMRTTPPRAPRNPATFKWKFDNTATMADRWRWKANLTMSPKGATGPQEPDNEMVSRFTMEGDFSVDLDADFGQAAYTNTGGMLIAVCGQDLGFDGGWNFGSWGGFTAKVRVQRRGDELQLIRDGWALVVPVPEAQRDKPTHWRLWWRSRASTFRSITVTADRLIVDKAEDAKGKKGN
jgi:hypothetical protein